MTEPKTCSPPPPPPPDDEGDFEVVYRHNDHVNVVDDEYGGVGYRPRVKDRLCCNYFGPNKEANAWAYDSMARGVLLISAVFMGTALLGLASDAAGCDVNLLNQSDDAETCRQQIYGFVPSSLLTVMTTVSGLVGAAVMPLVGAMVDHTPHRYRVVQITAILLIMINATQIMISTTTWFAVAVLQTIGPVVFLIHLVVVYAYLPDLTDRWDTLTRWQGTFVALRSLAMIPFLIVVVTLSTVVLPESWVGPDDTLERDVAVARISQIVLSATITILFYQVLQDGLQPKPSLRPIPEGQSVWTAGFAKLRQTLRTTFFTSSRQVSNPCHHRVFRWYCLGLVIDTSAVSSFVVIVITISTDFLKLSAGENGLLILLFLVAAIVGSKVYPRLVKRIGCLLKSLVWSDVLWGITMVVTSVVVRGPRQKNAFLGLALLWGFCFGWTVPNGRMVYIALMPKGQDSEYMGLFQFFGRGFLWLPPLLFTVLNEAGLDMNWSLLVLPAFLMVGAACYAVVLSDYDKAVLQNQQSQQQQHFPGTQVQQEMEEGGNMMMKNHSRHQQPTDDDDDDINKGIPANNNNNNNDSPVAA